MGALVFTGESGVTTYTAIALKAGLRLYAVTGMKPNSAWTPKAMMTRAASITGKTFKARDYAGAIAALEEWLQTQR